MKSHSLIADESVDFNIVNLLRKKGYTVRAIAESDSALSDENVLKISVTKKLLLLTETKTLVNWFIHYTSAENAKLVVLTLDKHFDKLKNVFSVLDERKIRIRR